MAVLMAYWAGEERVDSWAISGMLAGVYVGGTPNMQAVGLALGVEESTFILLNATDLFCSGIYLILLTSILPNLLARLLPVIKGESSEEIKELSLASEAFDWRQLPWIVGWTIIVIGISVGIVFLIFGDLKQVGVIILLLTTFSIASSLHPKVRQWTASYASGEYFLLIFCVAIGMLSDFSQLIAEGAGMIGYTACVLFGSVFLHYAMAYMLKIDRDTVMITSTAAVFGPVFVGQIASTLGNRQLVISGITVGLVGLALGNYWGIGIAWMLKWWLGG